MLPGPAVPGYCLVSFCFLCDIHSIHSVGEKCLQLVDVLQEEPDAGQAQHEERPVHDPLVILESRGPRKEGVLGPMDPENGKERGFYRVVQLNFTPKKCVFNMMFERSLSYDTLYDIFQTTYTEAKVDVTQEIEQRA